MSILLTTFFISLSGIIIMIGRKLVFARGEQIIELEHSHPFVPDLQKIKYSINKNTKKLGYVAVVLIIRFHVRSSRLLKQSYGEIKTKIKNRFTKNTNTEEGGLEKQEVSGFLKMISAYKNKIRGIRHRIRKEEDIG